MSFLPRAWCAFMFCCALSLVACGPGEADTTPGTLPAITSQPASATSTGDAVVLRVVATGGALRYQWYLDSVLLAGATEASYLASVAGSYDVVVSNTLGQVRSSAAVLTISTDPVITIQPTSTSVTQGRSARLYVVATGVQLSYQWFKAAAAIAGATASSYSASVADSYYVVVTSARTGAKAVTSATATLAVSATGIAPTITAQPVALSVTAGSSASFAVKASGTDLSYAWYRDSLLLASSNAPVYTIDAAAVVNAGSYYVVVTNGLGFASSTPVVLSVLPAGNGSNTAAVVSAARAFLDTLGSTQKSVALSSASTTTVLFAASLENARVWSALPGARHGLRLNTSTLSAAQLAAADQLISTALSAYGATLVSEIRLADDVYALRNTGTTAGIAVDTTAGAAQYSIAFIGEPSTTAPWMLQLTGHQLAHNITYNATQGSATPMFIGAQPPNWAVNSAGVYAINNTATSSGTPHAPMESQRAAVAALAFAVRSDPGSASAALLAISVPTDLLMAPGAASDTAFKTVAYPAGTTGRGLLYSSMSATQQAAVKAAIQAWVKTQAADVAQALLDAYLSDTALATTYVAYAVGLGGSPDFGEYPNASALPGSAANSYLRIDGPRVWIEFLVKADSTVAATSSTVHYRSVWRDKVADYGARF